MRRKILCMIPALLLICSISSAWATLLVEVTYSEKKISSSLWQYEFIVANTSQGADPIFDIWDVFLDLGLVPLTKIENIGMPNGWEYLADTVDPFIALTSLPPPDGADIAPGTSLGGFVFQLDAELGEILFVTTFFNPDGVPPSLDGSVTPSDVVSIPEPATFAFVSVGLAGVGLYTRRKRIH